MEINKEIIKTTKEEKIFITGTVVQVLTAGAIIVDLVNKIRITCYISKKIKKYNLNIAPGDLVDVEMSPFDLNKGKIINRYQKER